MYIWNQYTVLEHTPGERDTEPMSTTWAILAQGLKPFCFVRVMASFAVAISGPVGSPAEFVVEWYSPLRGAFVEFSRHTTRAEAEQTRIRLFAIIAEVDLLLRWLTPRPRSTAAHANAPGRAHRWHCRVRPWVGV